MPQPAPVMTQPAPAVSRAIGFCALALIIALYVVGLVSHGVIRHVVQTLPVWPAVGLGVRQSRWSKWFAMPVFVMWLLLMIQIWLFLLGWLRLLSGTFTPIEIALTIIIAVSSAAGLVASLGTRTSVSWPRGIAVVLAMAAFQLAALYVSFMPKVARDPW